MSSTIIRYSSVEILSQFDLQAVVSSSQFQDHSKVPSSHVNVNSEELDIGGA